MGHTAKALVLHCIDFRFVHDIVHFLKTLGLESQYDDVSAAGATKNIVDPYDPKDPEFILRQVEIAKKLHSISQVILINHLDCGAYGRGTFANEQEERNRHLKDLAEAKRIVERRFEELDVQTVLARIDQAGTVDFEKVG